jgi:cyclic pyranopterin phosphate synthase
MLIENVHTRTFKTLRVSLLNSCNLACDYCVAGEPKSASSLSRSEKPLPYTALAEIIAKLHAILGLETIRLTGGEPTLYTELPLLVKKLEGLNVPIKLTTNGLLLKNTLGKLPEKAFDSINISLDSLDENIFFQISRRKGLHKILEGIELAISKNIPVKLNCVVMQGVNENQILPLLEYASRRKIEIRFLELMRMGHVQGESFESRFFSEARILAKIETQYALEKLTREPSSTANYWRTNTDFTFGIIANESEPFCQDCNRLRLDSMGNIYGCLSSNTPLRIVEHIENDLKVNELLMKAMAQKQPLKFKGSSLSMLEIGG